MVSDGPTTQYRSKKNLFFLSTEPFKMGFVRVTWNFLEAGHGKGPADGVGAAVKRTADALVAKGMDIQNGAKLYEKNVRNPDPCTCFSPQCVAIAPASEPSMGARLHQNPPTFQETKAMQPISDFNKELIAPTPPPETGHKPKRRSTCWGWLRRVCFPKVGLF
ncbi:hypothetical protein NHX12_027077 [Muraenolepis orangiensis]|uniref:Uncharacterized protein n=1 Tax=Muraenolepis orangiensis TaxID=630683 RepID=A0A9Q0EFY8_9TELE|nr:hypothetical protein NHX12_027077 [Muraenolepis orangiensis]